MKIPAQGRQGLVFTYADRPIKVIGDRLKTACQNSDIPYGQFTEGGFIIYFFTKKKNPVRGGYLTGLVGGGNEGKEETSFHIGIHYSN